MSDAKSKERPKAPKPVDVVAPVEARQSHNSVNMLTVLAGSLFLAGVIWVVAEMIF